MNCINRELIQKYIDGETNSEEQLLIEQHTSVCSQCLLELNSRRKYSEQFRNMIQCSETKKMDIPEFKVPKNFKTGWYSIAKLLIYTSSAACIIFFIAFFLIQEQKEETPLLYLTMETEYDANLPLQEQEMDIKLIYIDENNTNNHLQETFN